MFHILYGLAWACRLTVWDTKAMGAPHEIQTKSSDIEA